jgi:L-malate glycosyltransferase
MAKRKVLILTAWYPYKGNTTNGIFVHEQARLLARQYDLLVLYLIPIGVRGLLAGLKNGENFFKEKIDLYEGVQVLHAYFIYSKFLGNFLLNILYLLNLFIHFNFLLFSWGMPDIIHAHVVLPSGWAASIIGKVYRIPVILTEHTGPFDTHLQTQFQRKMVRGALHRFINVICVSPALKQDITAFSPVNHLLVMGNLIRTDFFTIRDPLKSLPAGRKQILTIAFLTPNKGIASLLEAGKILIERGLIDFDILIGGDGSDRSRLENLVSHFELASHVQFLGALSRDEVLERMTACDVFVLPSLHETFGIVIAEAMACGKPVISTRCGGPEFIIEPGTGILVENNNSFALADAIEDVLQEKVVFDREKIRQSIVTRFGEAVFVQNISQIYEAAWASSGGGYQ